jgi:hypothetical protein
MLLQADPGHLHWFTGTFSLTYVTSPDSYIDPGVHVLAFTHFLSTANVYIFPLSWLYSDNDKPIKSLLKGKGLLPLVGIAHDFQLKNLQYVLQWIFIVWFPLMWLLKYRSHLCFQGILMHSLFSDIPTSKLPSKFRNIFRYSLHFKYTSWLLNTYSQFKITKMCCTFSSCLTI